jgi:tryptophan-rich sensory protein
MSWVIAIAIAALCAGLEAWLSGPKPFDALAGFRQPGWALPSWGWMIVGGVFYVVMVFALGRMIEAGSVGAVAVALIVAVLVTDGFWNYLLFRIKRLDWAFAYLFPYAALVAVALWATIAVEQLAGIGIAIYLVFLPYDFAWTRALVGLNPALHRG